MSLVTSLVDRRRQRQRDVLSGIVHDLTTRPTDIRNRMFEEGMAVMGPCSDDEIIEGTILKIERRGGKWKLCIDPYRIGGVQFRGYVRWVERYWRFVIL